MSTKIYNGFKINLKRPTLMNLNKLFIPFRHGIAKLAEDGVAKLEAELAIEALDALTTGTIPYDSTNPWEKFNSPVYWASETIRQRYQNIYKNRARDPEYDFDCEVTIYPILDGTLAYVMCEKQEYLDFFESLPGVEEYGYWNNTDKPEEIDEATWRKRDH